MSRPLIQSRIGDLEEMFAADAGKPDVLRQLEHELQFRQVPRAVALLEKVQRVKAKAGTVMTGELAASAKADVAPVMQHSSAQNLAASVAQLSLLGLQHVAAQPEQRPMTSVPSPASTPAKPSRPIPPSPIQEATPAMSLADACRLLKVTTGASWESIEQARRAAVQKSSPMSKGTTDANRTAELAAARLANVAYAALSTARCTSKTS